MMLRGTAGLGGAGAATGAGVWAAGGVGVSVWACRAMGERYAALPRIRASRGGADLIGFRGVTCRWSAMLIVTRCGLLCVGYPIRCFRELGQYRSEGLFGYALGRNANKGKGNNRSPSGMTTRKATATANSKCNDKCRSFDCGCAFAQDDRVFG